MKWRSKPKGWRGESARHSLAARGIPTVARGVRFSSIKNQDDFQDFLGEERQDIARRKIADARFQVSRDRRDIERLKEIDIRILHAMEDDEIDLAEILADAKYSDRDLRARGILQTIREKIIPKKKVHEGVAERGIDKYYAWFKNELDKRNRKLAKAPSDAAMDIIEVDFDAKVTGKRQELGLSPPDTAEVEADARMYMTIYQPSERTLVQREKASIHPMKMVRTATELPPERIAEKFNEMSLDRDYSAGESSTLDMEASKRDVMLDTISVASPEIQKDVGSVMERDRYKAEREYREELSRNRSLRVDIGRAMDEEWSLREDEIKFRERQINEAERALVAGGIVIPAGLLSSLAMGIGGALSGSLGKQSAPSQMSSSGQTSPTLPAQTPPPAPTVSSEYLLIKKSDVIGTVTPKGGE